MWKSPSSLAKWFYRWPTKFADRTLCFRSQESFQVTAPIERFGAGVQRGQLITRGKAQHDGTRAGVNILLHPVDHLIPRTGDTKHGVGHRFKGTLVIFRQELLTLDNGSVAAGGEGKINARMNRVAVAAGGSRVVTDFFQPFAEQFVALDAVYPGVGNEGHGRPATL